MAAGERGGSLDATRAILLASSAPLPIGTGARMPADRWQQLKDVFQRALECSEETRRAFLDKACAGDPTLRGDVESLLASHAESEGFLSEPGFITVPTGDAGPDVVAGDDPQRVGRYRILGQAGRGGMGTVYRAVRDDDTFHKTVALKLVRAAARTPTSSSGASARSGRSWRASSTRTSPRCSTAARSPTGGSPTW